MRLRAGGQERRAQAEESTAGPGADGKRHRAQDRAQLERDAVRDHPAADRDEEIGNREVEGVEEVLVVPARIPAREVPVAQQRLEELGHRDVRTRVTAGGRRVREQHARVQLRKGDEDHAGDRDHRDRSRHPPPAAAPRLPGLFPESPDSPGRSTASMPRLVVKSTPNPSARRTPRRRRPSESPPRSATSSDVTGPIPPVEGFRSPPCAGLLRSGTRGVF